MTSKQIEMTNLFRKAVDDIRSKRTQDGKRKAARMFRQVVDQCSVEFGEASLGHEAKIAIKDLNNVIEQVLDGQAHEPA